MDDESQFLEIEEIDEGGIEADAWASEVESEELEPAAELESTPATIKHSAKAGQTLRNSQPAQQEPADRDR